MEVHFKRGSVMPLKIVKVEQLTRPTRQKQSVVTSLPEFIEATLKLSHGLKPQEGIEISLPKKDERGYKHIAFGMKKHLRAYLDRLAARGGSSFVTAPRTGQQW